MPGPSLAVGPGPASADRMLRTVHRLAADRYAGRRVGAPGNRAAGAWLAGQLRSLGAAVSRAEFPVAAREWDATPVVRWRHGGQVRRLVHRREIVAHPASKQLPVRRSGPLAVSAAADWRDRWVLVSTLTPQATGRAVDQGAAGLLVPRGADGAGWLPKMIAGPPAGPVPVLGVRADLHQLMTTGAAGGGAPAEVSADVPLRTVATTGVNVYGTFAEPAPAGTSILLTAHYDGVGDDPDQRLPAAADNASGVAAVLEAARLLAPIMPAGVGLRVALLDAEEVGALGSAHHASQLPAGTQVVNVDGAARLGPAAAVEAGGPAEALLTALDQAGREVGVPLRGGPVASDNRRYAAAGLPAVGLGMGVPGFHTPADTPERVDPATLAAAARLVTTTVWHLCQLNP
jgi:acetylornithine deacetylase/succinyl-diaminopimelate desuccinylase-like protein